MEDYKIAQYYFPHCMMHWPDKASDYAKEAREMLKTSRGRSDLSQLREEYESTLENRLRVPVN